MLKLEFMPRVTPTEHYRRYQFIRLLFREPGLQAIFGFLPYSHQTELFRFYPPHQELTKDTLRDWHTNQQAESPSLANRAGKHFRVIETAFITMSREQGIERDQIAAALGKVAHTPRRRSGRRNASENFHIVPIANPDLDPKRVARAFMMSAEYRNTSAVRLDE